jgi:HEAT repeat protein
MIHAAEPATNGEALDRAFGRLRTYDWGESREALWPLDEAISASFDDAALRRRLEKRLIMVLATDAPTAAKVFACERLSRIGSAESIPALAALLANPELSHMARYALVRMPSAAASKALRRSLPAVNASLKVGIINSLGLMEDKQAVGLLTRLLWDPDVDIAAAAASALGCIATVEAARTLGEFRKHAPTDLQPVASSAWLLAAQRLAGKGQRSEAAGIFRQLYRAENSVPLRLAGFRGLITTEPNRAVELVSQALASEDDAVRGSAARLLADGPDAPPLSPFIQSFKRYPAAGQVAVLDALRWRQAVEGRPTALDAMQSVEPVVRIAGLRTLAVIGSAADVPLLARKSAGEGDAERETARSALAALPGKDVVPAITAELQTAPPEVSVELLRSLAARGAVAANPAIVERLAAPSAAVRTAALEALAALGGRSEILSVLKFLSASSDELAREESEKTLDAIAKRAGPAVADDLLVGLKDPKADSQVVVLRALGIAGGPKALEAVRALLGQKDSPLRGSAFRILTEWSGPEAAPDLLALARAPENPTWGVLAFRGYVRLCREAQIVLPEKKQMLTEAMAIAKDPEQKRLVVSALGELHDPAALDVLNACLSDSELSEETCLAIVEIAAHSGPKSKDDIAPALQEVMKVSRNPDVRKEAQKHLDRLGAKPE